jgi:hypothetical protein
MFYPTNPDLATPVGRGAELAALRALLDRDTPSNVSVVGPKGIGKTLLLRALAGEAPTWGRFAAVALWDVRRRTPPDDDAFFAGAAGALAEALAASHADLAAYLRDDPSLDMVQEVLGELEREGARVLLLVDHLERALRAPGISKGLWDNLRDLVVRGALVLVTTTPRRLRVLTDADARTSEFWNVFAPPVELGPFSPADVALFLGPLDLERGPLAPPTRKEFDRQTGGVPLLCALLAGHLAESATTTVEKATVADAAGALAHESDHVANLWGDLAGPAQDLLVELAVRGEEGVPAADVSRDRLADLGLRGYVTQTSGGRVAPRARMVLDHAALHRADAGDLARLFGPDADANANARALLELRLDAVSGGPAYVRSDAERALHDLKSNPARALSALRELAHTSLDAVWNAHFPDRKLPQETVDAWHQRGSEWVRRQALPLVERGYKLPVGRNARAAQEKVLGLLTDPAEHGEVSVSDGTFRLIVALRELGNYGHHVADSGTETVPFQTAAAACELGVELFRRLTAELPKSAETPPDLP